MERHLFESILVSAIIELDGKNDSVITDAFSKMIQILIDEKDIFEKIPCSVYISATELADRDKNDKGEVAYFDQEAALIYDGLHASAFGQMEYIYRSKGVRIYVFRDGNVCAVTPYCCIGQHGLQIDNDPWDMPDDDYNDPAVVRMLFQLLNDDPEYMNAHRFICGDIIKAICSIKRPYDKAFFLEYLLTPPDVDKISEFSTKARELFWDICLSVSFADRWGREVQEACMNMLSSLGISPSPGQILSFIRNVEAKDGDALTTILSKLSVLETNVAHVVTQTSPQAINVLELKPNIGGIGINVNEIFSRLKAWMKARGNITP